jgi:hypothetical protein
MLYFTNVQNINSKYPYIWEIWNFALYGIHYYRCEILSFSQPQI